MMRTPANPINLRNRHRRGFRCLKHWELYLFLLPAMAYVLLFDYWPMYGVQIAFKDFRVAKGIWDSDWVGLKHFVKFLTKPAYLALIRNTLQISLFQLIVSFPMPILLALTLNELRVGRFKRVVQTVSYAPHFISTVVMASMIKMFLDPGTGIVNQMIGVFGAGPYDFMSNAEWFPSIYVYSGVWQSMGWSSVIFLSALSGIDSSLHEAAMIDGASRLQRIWHINLPGILPTITILLILNTGKIMSVGFEKVYLLQNALNLERSEIISTFVYKIGILYNQYSFSTAIGLFNSIVNFILLISVNTLSQKLSKTGLW